MNENDKVQYRWYKKRKANGIIKASNKFQMLNAYIAFLFELPLNIHEGAPYRFKNHDNEYVLTYQVVKKVSGGKRKVKEKKLSKKELKALAKVQKAKDKKDSKDKEDKKDKKTDDKKDKDEKTEKEEKKSEKKNVMAATGIKSKVIEPE